MKTGSSTAAANTPSTPPKKKARAVLTSVTWLMWRRS